MDRVISEPMVDDARSDRVLFCPFCRESFEGLERCPEHELALVEFQALPRQAHERQVDWNEPVAPWELRFGRGWLALGAALAVVGFFLPMASGMRDGQPYAYSGWDLARGPAFNLWTVPFVAALFVAAFLMRRRTPLQMRSARIAGVALALMPAASTLYSMANVARGVEGAHGAMTLAWGAGAWVVLGACAPLAIGSLRFGAMPGGGGAPHGAEPERDSAIQARESSPPPGRKRRRGG